MDDECHPEFTHASFSQLGRFIRGVDRKIGDMLEDFRAEGNEMTWVLEALRNNQESMKRRLRDVICTIFEENNEDELVIGGRNSEESVELVEALARVFWKKEEQIDGRMNKCYELFGEVQCQKAEDESKHATVPDQSNDLIKIEEVQEADAIELKRSREESRVEVKGPSMAEKDLEAALSRTRENFSELTCFTRRVDQRIESLKRNFKQDEDEMAGVIADFTDWQESLKERLNELRESYFETENEDEILEVAIRTEEPLLLLTSMLQSLMKEEQQIDFWVGKLLSSSSDCAEVFEKVRGEKAKESAEPDIIVPNTGRSEEKMTNCVTAETKLGSEGDQSSESDISNCDLPDLGEFFDHKITEEDGKAMEERRKAMNQTENILKILQKHIGEGLKCRATKVQVEVSLLAVELFLVLSTNGKGSKFHAFKSCLEDIEREKRNTKVVKSIIEMLNVADQELSKVKMSSRREETDRSFETDDDKKLQEDDIKRVEELFPQFIGLIAHLEAHTIFMGDFESQLLPEEAIQGYKKSVKDMEREVEDMESKMEALRSKFSYVNLCPVLAGIARAQCGLGVQKS